MSGADSSSDRQYRDKQWLRQEYIENGRTSKEIAEQCEVSDKTILRWMDRFGIETRDPSVIHSDGDVEPLQDEQWLRTEYGEKGRSTYEIAQTLGVSQSCVHSWMDRHGIERRGASVSRASGDTKPLQDEQWLRERYHEDRLSTYEIADLCGVTRPTVCNWMKRHEIEIRAPTDGDLDLLKDEQWVRREYIEKERTTVEIAETVGVDHSCVRDWMDRHGIDRREIAGENHPAWKGGEDRYYGPFWPEARRMALRRDQYRCQRCGITDPEHIEERGRGLHVHHIKPVRTFDDHEEANDLGNLISLCTGCHSAVEWETGSRSGGDLHV